MSKKVSSEKMIKDIRRRTRTKYSSEQKIRIVLDGIRGETSPSELCRRESISSNLYYRWSKDFLEAGKKRLQRDTVREASTQEVSELKKENQKLKQLVTEVNNERTLCLLKVGTVEKARSLKDGNNVTIICNFLG